MPEENLADPTADVKEEDKVPLLSGDAEAPAENGKSATVFGAIRTLVGGSNGELRIPVELEYEKNFTVFLGKLSSHWYFEFRKNCPEMGVSKDTGA